MEEPKPKKRKSSCSPNLSAPTAKPAASFTSPTSGRQHTLSLALPSSILTHAQSHELRTLLAGTVARSAAVFGVDEIIVFQDGTTPETKAGRTTEMLVHVLIYLETPPYLRKRLFPLHANLKFVGTLPPLDIPSHYRTADEGGVYREAVAVARDGDVTVIDAGLKRRVVVREEVPVGARVTVKFDSAEDGCGEVVSEEEIVAACVAQETPRTEAGIYWGYSVRNADSLAAVFTECPFEGGYDVTVGTSEGGEDVAGVLGGIPEFSHMLIAFGGLEQAFRADEELVETGVAEVREIFDFWVDLCPNNASSAIRTEEAVWIALSKLGDTITKKARKI